MSKLSSTSAPSTAISAMAEGLARLWAKFLPEIQKRIAVLESFVCSVVETTTSFTEDGPGEVVSRSEALAAAHKLAGTLGTFGIARGTELARQIEHLLVEPGELGVEDRARLSEWVGKLRLEVENRAR